ncbi:hypothetical protein QU481_12280 [Crenobacter sp. SG2303]|uniref:Uncharacterized protein n=1 Tax=Crenobacter oryzisoli TaxID=3056844 RepID=A0ABT7XPG2_9NEIS|nr:hypothetical protein [Crenobacter sp. SG2303]MDN0075667.1 hypothetical protein [Crenobacter sp. SG2303]
MIDKPSSIVSDSRLISGQIGLQALLSSSKQDHWGAWAAPQDSKKPS